MKSSLAQISWLFSWTSCEAAAAAAAVAAVAVLGAVCSGGACCGGGCCGGMEVRQVGSSSLEQRLFSSFWSCEEQAEELEAIVASIAEVVWEGYFISCEGYGHPPKCLKNMHRNSQTVKITMQWWAIEKWGVNIFEQWTIAEIFWTHLILVSSIWTLDKAALICDDNYYKSSKCSHFLHYKLDQHFTRNFDAKTGTFSKISTI